MAVTFRKYNPVPLFGADYYSLREFLLKLDNYNYPFGRWDWMITHGTLDASGLSRIGLWEEDGVLVAVATYDCVLGKAFLLTLSKYRILLNEMLHYAQDALAKDDMFQVLVLDGDIEMQDIAAKGGYIPTQDKECDSFFPIDVAKITYTLPNGFRLISLAQNSSAYEVGRVMWKGFNHELRGEGAFSPSRANLLTLETQLHRPNVDLSIKIAALSPEGHFASYCGMWHDNASDNALVEPVATDPAYRRMGLGRAVVLEAIRCCGLRGAKNAFVGSSQQFYYSIGFRPYATSTWWVRT